MQYRIGDVARVLGITPNALHFFEKEDILTVKKDESGYRNYSIHDVFRLLSYQKYRSMGYHLKTVRQQFEYEFDNRASILRRVEAQKEEAIARAAHYERLASVIERHLADMRKIDRLLDDFELVHEDETVFLFDDEGGWISKHKPSQLILHQWVDAMPIVRLSFLGEEEGDGALIGGTLGYMAQAADVYALGLPVPPHAHRQPACTCLHTIIATDDSFLENPAHVFAGLGEQAKKRGLTPCGRPWGMVLLVEIRPDKSLRPYLSLRLPVTP